MNEKSIKQKSLNCDISSLRLCRGQKWCEPSEPTNQEQRGLGRGALQDRISCVLTNCGSILRLNDDVNGWACLYTGHYVLTRPFLLIPGPFLLADDSGLFVMLHLLVFLASLDSQQRGQNLFRHLALLLLRKVGVGTQRLHHFQELVVCLEVCFVVLSRPPGWLEDLASRQHRPHPRSFSDDLRDDVPDEGAKGGVAGAAELLIWSWRHDSGLLR